MNNNNKPTTVIVAEDQAIIREGLVLVCQNRELQVLGQCSDGMAALEMIRTLKPDFALLDLNMPKLTGLQVVRKVRETEGGTRCIILTISREESSIREALKVGVDGYLLKDGPPRHLIDAINYIRDGGVYVSPLLRMAGLLPSSGEVRENDPLAHLSRREHDVFYHLVNGLRAKEIANLLDISPKTVDTYRASLMRKLSIHDLVALVKFAIEHNLTTTK
ncbi:MAG TPA: response regulator transcription factor [Bryobacteraceae bacterium]|nr:response regulator transcription factor [Bryobacteraceae bacterium]